MTKSLVYIILFSFVLVSCDSDSKKAEELVQRIDKEVFNSSMNGDSLKVDSLLSVLNLAIGLDSNIYKAYEVKGRLLYEKKDVIGLMNNYDDLIRLSDSAYKAGYYVGKGLMLELNNNDGEAYDNYIIADSIFKEVITSNPNSNIIIQLSYIQNLVFMNKMEEAELYFKTLKEKNINDIYYEDLTFEKVIEDIEKQKSYFD